MLPERYRLVRDEDWKRLHRRGRIYRSPKVLLKVAPNQQTHTRIGFSVSTKVFKRAVRRNQIKRKLRAIISQECTQLKPGYDIGVVVRKGMAEAASSTEGLRGVVQGLLRRARLYKSK